MRDDLVVPPQALEPQQRHHEREGPTGCGLRRRSGGRERTGQQWLVDQHEGRQPGQVGTGCGGGVEVLLEMRDESVEAGVGQRRQQLRRAGRR